MARFILETGKLFFADRQVDLNTGTLQIVGLFPNPNFILRPGQYGACARKRKPERTRCSCRNAR